MSNLLQQKVDCVNQVVFDYAMRGLALKVKDAILTDDAVSPALRHFLAVSAPAALGYYLANDLGSSYTHSGREGREQLGEFNRQLEAAEVVLQGLGFSSEEVRVYETVALLAHPHFRSERGSFVSSLYHNTENGVIPGLVLLCGRYGLVREGQFLGELMSFVEQYERFLRRDDEFAKRLAPWWCIWRRLSP